MKVQEPAGRWKDPRHWVRAREAESAQTQAWEPKAPDWRWEVRPDSESAAVAAGEPAGVASRTAAGEVRRGNATSLRGRDVDGQAEEEDPGRDANQDAVRRGPQHAGPEEGRRKRIVAFGTDGASEDGTLEEEAARWVRD